VAGRALRDRLEAAGEALRRAVSDDDADAVHALRVASRRAAAAVTLFDEFIPGRRAKRWLGRLKRLRKTAGRTRDADVQATWFTDPTLQDLVEDLHRESRRGRNGIRRVARVAERKGWFVDSLRKLLRRIDCRAEWRDERFDTWAAESLASAAERFLAGAPTDDDPRGLHQFRIRAKELRYTLELLSGALSGPDADAVYRSVEAIQTDLGAVNDTSTRLAFLRDCLRRENDPATYDHLHGLVVADEEKLDEECKQFLFDWSHSRGDRFRQELDRVLRPVSVVPG
jgi:CHAD domain-containing protein